MGYSLRPGIFWINTAFKRTVFIIREVFQAFELGGVLGENTLDTRTAGLD